MVTQKVLVGSKAVCAGIEACPHGTPTKHANKMVAMQRKEPCLELRCLRLELLSLGLHVGHTTAVGK